MKSQNEYLQELEEELRYLKPKEINEIVKHYRDKISVEIDYGVSEEKVIEQLPNPSDVAKNIYDSRGISYLEIQKRRYRRKQIVNAIISSIILVVLAVLFTSLLSYLAITTVNMNTLIGRAIAFEKMLDTILTVLFVILYDILLILALIYIIDLLYILCSYFLINVLKTFNKTYKTYYKFQDFTINGFLSKKTKIEKFPLKAIGIVGILLVIVLISSVSTKGYVYRALMDKPEFSEILEYDLNTKEININANDANVYFVIDESTNKVSVNYQYEFKNTVDLNYQEKVLTINKNSVTSFDIFKLLDEPTPIIYITLPSLEYLKKINIKIEQSGIVSFKDINTLSLETSIDLYSGRIYLENVNAATFKIDTFKADIKIANTTEEEDMFWINNLDINVDMGSVSIEGYRFNKLNLVNSRASLVLSKLEIREFILNNGAGSIVMNEISGRILDYTSKTSVNRIYDLVYDEATIKLFATCSLDVTRMYVKNDLKVNLSNQSSFLARYLKTNNLAITSSSSTIIIYDFNHNAEITEEDQLKALKETFNSYQVAKPKVSIENTSGDTLIDSSNIDTLELNQKGKQIELSNINLNKLTLTADNVKIVEASEVYGNDVFFILYSSKLKYYNDNDTNQYRIKYTGTSGIETNRHNYEVIQ